VKEAPIEDRHSEEKAEAIESGRHAVEELLESLSEFVSGLVESNMSYDSKMKDHKTSIDQAMTMAGLEEIKRLLTREIEGMESTSENYRRQPEHANITIRDQQEIMERFRIDAKMDFLTKIANRRAFQARLKEEFERAKRYKSVFTLIMIDIDHFKKVNDVYGHMAGDEILRLIAQVLEDQTRFNDFVCRYGGEEFAVLLPESAADQGRYVADKIRQAVENTSLLYANSKLKVTVSAGVGQVNPERDTPETFIDRVDAALYQAKENGRNRVELTDGPQDG
jgi:diguanylate cyclase (GGDEF)-like protein